MNEILKKAGLTGVQTEIYNYLLANGEFKASDLALKIKRPRGVVYKGLEELIGLKLVEKRDDENMVSRFKAEHPSKLENLFSNQEKNIKSSRQQFIENLPALTSLYNLTNNKPGVRFFEGEEGVWEVLKNTLSSKTEILTIADVEAVEKYLKEVNKKYVAKRNKLGIKKRLLALDSEYARGHFKNVPDTTDVKLIKLKITPFSTSIHIYDNKIAYITMTKDNLFSTLIEDPNIYSMHKALFDSIWSAN